MGKVETRAPVRDIINEMALKLNVGCGKKIMKGFVNLDILPLPGVDVVCDISKLPYADGVVDYLYACHVLEHASRHSVDSILKEWARVLRSGALIRIAVPNFRAVCQWYLEHNDIDRVQGLVVGGQKDQYDSHTCIFDKQKLMTQMRQAGFTEVRRYSWEETEHADQDDYSQACLPHMQKETGWRMSLNLQGRKI